MKERTFLTTCGYQDVLQAYVGGTGFIKLIFSTPGEVWNDEVYRPAESVTIEPNPEQLDQIITTLEKIRDAARLRDTHRRREFLNGGEMQRFVLHEKDGDGQAEITGQALFTPHGIELYFEGHGTFNNDKASPVFIDFEDGEICIHIWADTAREERTHRISLDKARYDEEEN